MPKFGRATGMAASLALARVVGLPNTGDAVGIDGFLIPLWTNDCSPGHLLGTCAPARLTGSCPFAGASSGRLLLVSYVLSGSVPAPW